MQLKFKRQPTLVYYLFLVFILLFLIVTNKTIQHETIQRKLEISAKHDLIYHNLPPKPRTTITFPASPRTQRFSFDIEYSNSAPSSFSSLSSSDPLPLVRNIKDPPHESDIPLFFHIPKVGGSTVKNILSSCYNLKRPNREPKLPSASLEVVGNYVNVDTSTVEGITKSKELNLIPSKILDVVVSPRIYEVQKLFTSNQKARMFTMMRHPFQRLYSYFMYLKHAVWERHHDNFQTVFKNITFVQYLKQPYIENNWMTHMLTDTKGGVPLTHEHVQLATNILRTKCLIGLTEQFNASISRFQHYFHWHLPHEKKPCLKRLVFDSPVNQFSKVRSDVPRLQPGTQAWNILLDTNKFDLQLYENAKLIFEEQRHIINY